MLTAQTITSIYDASFSENHWHRSLDSCANAMQAKACLLYEFPNLRQVNFALEAASSVILSIADKLAEYNELIATGQGSGFDQEGLGATHQSPAFEVLLDKDIWKIDADHLKRPEIAIVTESLGALRRSLINLSDDPSTFRGAVFLYGREHDDQLPDFTRGTGSQLAPHLAKTVELNRLTAGLRRRYNAALSVLDKIETGVFILVENGEVILSNRAAKETLDDDRGLTLMKDNRLLCHSSHSQAELLDAVSSVSQTAVGENDEAGRFIEIARSGTEQPLLAVLSPLRDAEIELDKDLNGALMTLIDPRRPMRVQPEALARAYGLTPAEKRLSQLLVTGKTTKEMSEQLNVSPETIKTQLSSIYSKSGCRNRLSFIWRLFQFAPPII